MMFEKYARYKMLPPSHLMRASSTKSIRKQRAMRRIRSPRTLSSIGKIYREMIDDSWTRAFDGDVDVDPKTTTRFVP
jgi:hypothetical protein